MTTTKTTLLAMLALSGAAALPGCQGDREDAPPRQFFPDMDDQPKWKPQAKSEFFPDHRTMRKPVTGTVPFDRHGWGAEAPAGSGEAIAARYQRERADFLKENIGFYEGAVGSNQFLDTIPIEVTSELIAQGQKSFNIYCAVCHNYTGDGNGLVGQVYTVKPANLHDPKYKTIDPSGLEPLAKDGYIFSVIRNGVRSMPAYGHAMSERETWGVVAYVRALQLSQEGTMDEVPADQRAGVAQQFTEMPDPAPATPPASGTPAAPGGTPSAPAPTPPTAPTGGTQ